MNTSTRRTILSFKLYTTLSQFGDITDFFIQLVKYIRQQKAEKNWAAVSPAGGGPPGHGFWVQPHVYGCAGFIQPVQMACY
jgi:hypothetical protein